MMIPGLDSAKRAARRAARNIGLVVLAGVFLLVGLGFLTAAAFLGLAAINGPIFAAIVLALVYAGIGAVLVAVVVSGEDRPEEAKPEDQQIPWATIVQVFTLGVGAARGFRRRD